MRSAAMVMGRRRPKRTDPCEPDTSTRRRAPWNSMRSLRIVAAFLVGLSDGLISAFFSPTVAKIVATLLVGVILAVRTRGLLGEETA